MSAAAVRYQLRFAQARQHCVDVEMHLPHVPAGPVVLRLPAWSPGSYMLRDYARHVEAALAEGSDGQPLPCRKTRKDEFVIDAPAAGGVRFSYRVYARELSVRTNFVNEQFALLQGTATFFRCPDLAGEPHEVRLSLPKTWQGVWSGGSLSKQGDAWLLAAEHYDALVDTPLLAGSAQERSFVVGGVPHALVSVGGEGTFAAAPIAEDCARIVAQNRALWGSLPYARYVFLNLLLGGQGGLEHRDSSVLMASPFAPSDGPARQNFAGLVAHEHFHVWNIKRLRPKALGPFDYSQENYTTSLWIAEGLTAYYDDLQACRAGVLAEADYLARLGKSFEALASTPGRLLTPLSRSSFDAWIKLYRRDENTDNTTVSYYLKGSLVGFLLDALLRSASQGTRSLDDVMRRAYARFAGAEGYTEADFRAVVGEVAQTNMAPWLSAAVDGTGELDAAPALAYFGLELKWSVAAPEQSRLRDASGVLGAHFRESHGGAVVSQVVRDSPAWLAGLNVDDEVIAIDDQRVHPERLLGRLAAAAEGQAEVTLLISRFGRLQRLPVRLAKPRASRAALTASSAATEAQRAARAAWLAPLTAPAKHRGAPQPKG